MTKSPQNHRSVLKRMFPYWGESLLCLLLFLIVGCQPIPENAHLNKIALEQYVPAQQDVSANSDSGQIAPFSTSQGVARNKISESFGEALLKEFIKTKVGVKAVNEGIDSLLIDRPEAERVKFKELARRFLDGEITLDQMNDQISGELFLQLMRILAPNDPELIEIVARSIQRARPK